MKNDKKKDQLKDHKDTLKNFIRSSECNYSEIKYPSEITLPSEISQVESENIFSKMFNSFYERQRNKAITEIKNCKEKIGSIIFKHQVDYLANNPTAKHKLDGFSHSEAVGIYTDVLEGNF